MVIFTGLCKQNESEDMVVEDGDDKGGNIMDEEIKKHGIGDLIRRRRKEKHLRGIDLAELIGVAPSTISHWEHEERIPRNTQQFLNLLDLLEFDVEEQNWILHQIGFAPLPGQGEEGPWTELRTPHERMRWLEICEGRIAALRKEIKRHEDQRRRAMKYWLFAKGGLE